MYEKHTVQNCMYRWSSWWWTHDPETKRQSAQWKTANSPRPKKFRQSKSRVKPMLPSFFYIRICTNLTVNLVCYLKVLERLHEKVWRQLPKPFTNNLLVLQHDNALAHTALSVTKFLATKQISVGTPCLFTRSSPQLLFLFHEDKWNIERKTFLWHWWHQE
jgi:hypothetical protein